MQCCCVRLGVEGVDDMTPDPGDHVACSKDSGQQCGGGCDRVLGLDILPGGGRHRGLQLSLPLCGPGLHPSDILSLPVESSRNF